MSAPSGDPRQVKESFRTSYDDTAHGHKKWQPVLEPAERPVTEALLELAGVKEGSWALDVCCGLGDVALAAARRVGPSGRVVGIDLSRRSLAIAEERARAEGLGHVGFQEQDAETLVAGPAESYDAVLSRFGLSFLPQLELALAGIHRVLMRGARVAAASWGAEDRVPFISVARAAAADYIGRALPSASMPGPFALSRPGHLEQALSSGGFSEIRGERLTVVFNLPSAEAYVQLIREATSIGQLVAEGATVGADEVWRAVAEATAPYAAADGSLSFPCDVVCVGARRA